MDMVVREMVRKETYEFLKHAFVKCSFRLSTSVVFLCVSDESPAQTLENEKCYLVVSLQAVPMFVKLFETVLSHLGDPNGLHSMKVHNQGIPTTRTSLERTE